MGSKSAYRLQIIPDLERAAHSVALLLSRRHDLDVTQAEANLLAYLYAGRTAPLNDIYVAFGHRRSTLSSVLDRLVKRNLVSRRADPSDGRAVLISLTAAGAKLAARVMQVLQELEVSALRSLSKESVEQFHNVTKAIANQARAAQEEDAWAKAKQRALKTGAPRTGRANARKKTAKRSAVTARKLPRR